MEYCTGLVSVVIPTHNRDSLICRAVDTALSQTYQNIEVIVVSDGSTDNTDMLMREYERIHDNLTYISYKPGLGGNHARNTGIRAAKGEYVAFLDDDDEWHQDKVEKQVAVLEKDVNVGLVCTAMNAIDDASGKTRVFVPDAPYDCSKAILKHNYIGSTTTVIVRHKLLDEVGMFDEQLIAKQDFDLWIRLCQITKVAVVRTPCVEYHNLFNNGQISWDYTKYAAASQYMWEKYEALRRQHLSDREMKDIQVSDNLSIARKAMKTGNRRITRKYAKEALKVEKKAVCFAYFIASFFPLGVVKSVNDIVRNTGKKHFNSNN